MGTDILGVAISQMESRSKRKPGDRVVKDGTLLCGVCGKPKRARVDFSKEKDGSDIRIVAIGCDCNKRRLAEEAVKAARERLAQMRESGGISHTALFERADTSPEMDRCWKYAANWERARNENIGLLLWGDVGTGKTFAAHCICNALLTREQPARAFVTSLSRVLNSGWDKSEITKRIRTAPLVVFDDLGAERESDYALENIFMMVDERYRARKPLIVTTNLTLEEMRNPCDIRSKRIYDRILEICVPIQFRGPSRRGDVTNKKYAFARDVLGF